MTQLFTVDDLYRHRKITELNCVAGLDQVACTVRSVDKEKRFAHRASS